MKWGLGHSYLWNPHLQQASASAGYLKSLNISSKCVQSCQVEWESPRALTVYYSQDDLLLRNADARVSPSALPFAGQLLAAARELRCFLFSKGLKHITGADNWCRSSTLVTRRLKKMSTLEGYHSGLSGWCWNASCLRSLKMDAHVSCLPLTTQ